MPFRVFYLDDEVSLLEIFQDTFASPEIEVTTFSDPEMILSAIKSQPPDVVFLDYRLPKTNGDKVAQQIDPKIPIALITGDLTVKAVAKFDRQFPKPFPVIDIEAFIYQSRNMRK